MSRYNTIPKKSHDVYLSFCSKDTGSFVSDLYTALFSESTVTVLWDKNRLSDRDWVMKPSLLDAIEKCKIAIIVFSRNYAHSVGCLQELEKITECCQTTGIVVVTLFYFDEENTTENKGLFGKAFYDFVDRISTVENYEDKFMSWVAAINKATIFSQQIGFEEYTGYKPHYKHIQDVVRYVTLVLSNKDLSFAVYLMQIRPCVQDVIQLLNQSKHLLLLGIWGMIGIGKSTIVRGIYDLFGPYFENRSFISFDKGEYFEKRKFQHKKVLVMLDGVTKFEELHFLCESPDWFGEGSKIIITTRNRRLLQLHGVDHIYEMKELDKNETLEIFNQHVFKQNKTPNKDYVELSRQLCACIGGVPLFLESLAHKLEGKQILFWQSHLKMLKEIPTRVLGIQQMLKSSLNDLNDKERELFFDIAYFFIGMNQEDVPHALQRSTNNVARQIRCLEEKTLVTIDENNRLGMQVLLQAMAREVIEWESRVNIMGRKFDVFLNFRGKDTRAKFISHLYSSLQNAAIYVFRDDDEIHRGDNISISLFQAIRHSKICIVVLSKSYANSRWCLLELERIIENYRMCMVIVPVFYEVDPSDIRNQTGEFGKAFNELISTISTNKSMIQRWRRNLNIVGSIAGFVITDSRNESADINNIVRHVTLLLDRMELFVAEHPVGLESRVQLAAKLLNIQKSYGMEVVTEKSLSIPKSEGVLILGIWGMGGMGKKTVAKAIYNEIGRKFEGRSFLLDIREIWEKSTNRVSIQQVILCDIYKTAAWKIHDIESGKVILKERLSQKRVLLVLDDVSELDQLKALCGSRKWFGPGSRIIITTRDMHLLRSCEVDHVYNITKMDESESLELFSWHAFKHACPKEDFTTLSKNVVSYSAGLPVALQVLGSFLYDRGIKEWERLLEMLKRIPNDQVQKKLKLSFDGLNYDTEKQIFLDIACFFIGMEKNIVIHILNGCEFFADVGVDVLIERSLVTVDSKNKLRMHDLLKTMGREIVREESPYNPEKRSRLWHHGEVLDILSKHKCSNYRLHCYEISKLFIFFLSDLLLLGNKICQGLALEFPIQTTICLHTKAFKKMNKLRLLQLAGIQLDGGFTHISRDLRWLCWRGFPSNYIPEEFQQRSLVAIEFKYGNLKQVWRKSQMMENLKFLNLSHSQDLVTTPDFSYMPNLEKLVLKDCPSLSTVSHTIGALQKLLLIDLTDCKGLRKLPRSIYTLKNLEILILSGCLMIEKLEDDVEQMESLITLIADRTGIKKVPFLIVRSKSIGYISLCGFERFARDVFPSLVRFWMSPTNNVISRFQTYTFISSHVSSDTFKDLLKLRSLCVECSSEQQLTQDVARILDALKATNCQKLEASINATISQICDKYACPSIGLGQICISGSKNYLKSLIIQMGTKCQVLNMVEDNILQITTDGTHDSSLLPCDNNSNSLNFSCKGCSVVFEAPQMKGHSLKRMILGIDYSSSSQNITSEDFQGLLVINYTKTTVQLYKRTTLTSIEDEEWQSITSNLEPGNKVEVMVVFGEGFIVKKTTLSLLYDEPNNNDFTNRHAFNEEDVIVSGQVDSEKTLNYSNPLGEEYWYEGKEENPSKKQKGKSKVVHISKSNNTTMTPKQDSQTITSAMIDTTSEDESLTLRMTRKRKKESSSKQTEKQKLSLPMNLKSKHSGEPSSTNSNLSHLDKFRKMLDVDPLAVMDQLLSNKVTTSQFELIALETELEKLRQLAFSDKLFAKLPNNHELQAAVSASIKYIESRHKDLNSQQYNGFSAFSKLFNKAIESINACNIVSHQLSQMECEEKEAMAKLEGSRNEIKQETKRMTEIKAESRQIEDQIAVLKEKTRLLKQEQHVLEDTYTSSKVKHEEAMNKGKHISINVISIRERIEGYKNQERQNNANYAELIDSYERMKACPPF